MNLEVRLHDIRCMPVRAFYNDAGADLKSIEDKVIMPGETSALVDTGVSIAVPDGFAAMIFSRSGQGKVGVCLSNGTGIIDSQYRGNIKLLISNFGGSPYIIKAYETKVAQMLIMPVVLANFNYFKGSDEEWFNTARGTGGFGSTGA